MTAVGSSSTLTEAGAKELLRPFGVPLLDERVVATADDAVAAAGDLGGPVVLKLNGEGIAHKTERGLVRLHLVGADAVREAADALLGAARPEDGDVSLLVAPMVSGTRELIAGVVRDPQFGPTVMLGVGGVLAEAVADVVFRLVPVSELDAREMVADLSSQRLLGEFRGEPAVDVDAVVTTILGLSRVAEERPDIASVDINPLIVVEGRPIAVDALVEVAEPGAVAS